MYSLEVVIGCFRVYMNLGCFRDSQGLFGTGIYSVL